eukprot:3829611-Pyramimonas_sp.AAC.2
MDGIGGAGKEPFAGLESVCLLSMNTPMHQCTNAPIVRVDGVYTPGSGCIGATVHDSLAGTLQTRTLSMNTPIHQCWTNAPMHQCTHCAVGWGLRT